MVNDRFFCCKQSFTLGKLAEKVKAKLLDEKDRDLEIKGVASLQEAKKTDISFLDNPKYLSQMQKTSAGACIIKEKYAEKAPEGLALLVAPEPYRTYAEVISLFYPYDEFPEIPTEIDETAIIEEGAVVCKGVKIGKNTIVKAGAVIRENVIIGEECIIGSNAVISHSILGNRVLIHPNVSIGQDGFGFAMGITHLKVKQLGTVIIEDDVEIGSGTCVDRGSMSDTVIGEGTKIDNLVQIGHNVKIGRHCVVVSQSGVSGSTTIGNRVIIGGKTGIAGHLTIGDGAMFAGMSGVTKDMTGGQTYGGFPAVPVGQWRRQVITLENISKKK